MTPVPVDINADPIGYSIQRTTNNGATWGPQISGTGIIAFDKEMIAADDVPASPFANNLYCVWMGAGSAVQFNRSTNQGTTFSNPLTLNDHWGQGANVQTGPNGEVYVCWADYTNGNLPEQGLGFVRSVNGGQNFTAASIVFNYTGIRNSSGGQTEFGGIRVNSFPSMAVDKSNGIFRGRIYIVYAAKENGNGKAIIQLRWSDNQGVNWSGPVTVSIANGRQNWFPWIAVDDNGIISIVYYSLDQSSGFSTNTYVAISYNGGNTLSNQVVSSVAHTTAPIPEFGGGYTGDYIGITAYGWKAYPAWCDNRYGSQWQNYIDIVDNSPVITGIPAFCSSATYTATNIPSNSTVTWSASPSGIISLSPSGNQVIVNKITQGNVTLSALVNGSKTVSLNITTVPRSIINYSMYGSCVNGIQAWYLSATSNMGSGTSWTWTVDNPGTSGIYIINPYSPSTYADVSKGGGVSLTYRDACGEIAQRNGVTIYSPCGHSYVVSPNPATSIITVSPANFSGAATNSTSTISLINIYDGQANLKKHQLFNKVASASINVSDLPLGMYIIEIIDGTNNERQKLQIIK